MKKMRAVCGAIVLTALVSACGSEPAADTAESGTPPAATQTAASTAPPAESTDTLDGTKLADFNGDPAKGEKLYLQCKTCHALEPGKNGLGPSLHGLIGHKSGEIAGFNYTEANKNSGIVWTPEKLNQYLEKPQRVVPGTRMAYGGMPQAQDRADLIAYLQVATK